MFPKLSGVAYNWRTGQILLAVACSSLLSFSWGYWRAARKSAGPNEAQTRLYGGEQELNIALSIIRSQLGADAVSTRSEDIYKHGHSQWSAVNTTKMPGAIVYPTSTDQVKVIARTCYLLRIPMVPFGGGSSVEAHIAAVHGGISIDLSRMNRVVALHEDDMDVVVQPGVSWTRLNEEIKDSGLFFPVDPGPTALIGGMVATSCSGTNAVRYGTMKDWVVNLTAVLADGTIIKTRNRPRKSSAGYNLTNLFIGSEGTLGFVTEATLRLAVLPEATSVAVATFRDIQDAANAAIRVLRAGIAIAAMELMDDRHMNIINRTHTNAEPWKETPTVFMKFGGSKATIEEQVRAVEELTRSYRIGDFRFAKSDQEAAELWAIRKDALPNLLSLRDEDHDMFSTDVAVPLSKLPDIISSSRKEADQIGFFSCCVGHVGDGNFHQSIRYNKNDPEQREKLSQRVHGMVTAALKMDGTCTGEHGIGMGKKDGLLEELGESTVDVMRKIKHALDDRWLMNPGKIFDE